MLRYLFLCFSLFMPMRISTLRSLKTFQSYNNRIVCMVPPPGAHSSKMADSGKLPEEGCEVNSEIVYHDNGDTTETISITLTKKIKRDQQGNVIKETDTSQPIYKSARDFFNGLSFERK